MAFPAWCPLLDWQYDWRKEPPGPAGNTETGTAGGEYVYVLWPHGRPLEPGIEAAVREAEGLTVVLPRERADSLGLHYDFVAAWITLEVHSALEAVGLTAAVGKALTDARISCNVLAGFHHDHLLVPVADAPRAVEALAELSAASRHVPRPELLLRNETAADRDKILTLTAEAFAVSPVTGLPVDGSPKRSKCSASSSSARTTCPSSAWWPCSTTK
ncbi:acetyltransferase [Arthrobacter sp. Hiyo4]|nr:acetyltransferase [Arthrobacter sp. Hiyo4]